MQCHKVTVSLVGAVAFFFAAFPIGGESLAAERFALLRLMPDGQVLEINPATRVAFKDLDRYLERRLAAKKVLDIKIQEPTRECDQTILIRYED